MFLHFGGINMPNTELDYMVREDLAQKAKHGNRRRAMKREKRDRLFFRALNDPTSEEYHTFGWLRKNIQSAGKGRPAIFPSVDEEAEHSETTEEYASAVENIADSLGIWMDDADYAVNKLGAIRDLIGLAYSMHKNRKMPFTRAVDEVADNEYTVGDVQKFERARELTETHDYRIGSAIDLLVGDGYKGVSEITTNLGSVLLDALGRNQEAVDMIWPADTKDDQVALLSDLSPSEVEEACIKMNGEYSPETRQPWWVTKRADQSPMTLEESNELTETINAQS